ncbi:MAG: stage II sporulation protein M [Rhodothermales bacterium]
MQEVAFLRQNADKWKQFEKLLHERSADPDRLAELFVEITDDLSYARTFYPESKTTRYLNGLAAEVHQAIYKNKREDRSRFLTFWTVEVPEAMAASRREMLLSLALFALSVGIGVISALNDDGFVRLILGDGYVNMTLENIEQGDPMAVYKQANEVDMFLGITFNNVRVSFFAFVMGLLGSFGTAYILFRNGVMLGAFHALFYQQDYLWSSLLVVYIHGALEISAIIIAGGAGLVMGNSILFPGTYSRRQSFMRGARRGVKIVVGLVPVFIAAGFLEGFVTRYTGMPLPLSLLIIAGSLGFIFWYFVVYPLRLHRSPIYAP